MRDLFHVPDNYFLNHSVGCLPRQAVESFQTSFIEPWREGTNWQSWMPIIDLYRKNIAAVLGVQSERICPVVNISNALTKIIYSFPKPEDRNVIVLSEQDFPTIGFVAEQAKRSGYEIQYLKTSPTNVENWLNIIGEKTAFVFVTHSLSNTSHILPVAEICTLARQAGAVSIVDVAQSLGAVCVPISEWACDFAIGTGVKFLCSGPGACFLYASQSILEHCEPVDIGWFSHENPFEMDIHHFEFAKDAMRFFGGTPSPAPYALANESLSLLQEIGLDNVHLRIQSHLDQLIENLDPTLFVSPKEPSKRGATLVINPIDRSGLKKTLYSKSIFFDERKEGFRFSVHGYTSEYEVSLLSEILTKLD